MEEEIIKQCVDVFDEGISSNAKDLAVDFAEISIDCIFNEGIIKDIPLVNTFVKCFGITKNILDKFYCKKILVFFKALHESCLDQKKYQEFCNDYQHNKEKKNKIMETVMVYLYRQDDVNKSEILGNLLWAHIDGLINWDIFKSIAFSLEHLDLQCVTYLDELEKEKTPYHKDYSSVDAFAAMLSSAGIGMQWGTHFCVVLTGILLHQYGIKKNYGCDMNALLRKAGYDV